MDDAMRALPPWSVFLPFIAGGCNGDESPFASATDGDTAAHVADGAAARAAAAANDVGSDGADSVTPDAVQDASTIFSVKAACARKPDGMRVAKVVPDSRSRMCNG